MLAAVVRSSCFGRPTAAFLLAGSTLRPGLPTIVGMLCPICKQKDTGEDHGYGAQMVCGTCDRRALNSKSQEPYTNSSYDEGDNPVFVDGRKCWRRYRFGGWITFLDEWDSPTLDAFYEVAWAKAAKNSGSER